jgi:hypothetical protein
MSELTVLDLVCATEGFLADPCPDTISHSISFPTAAHGQPASSIKNLEHQSHHEELWCHR